MHLHFFSEYIRNKRHTAQGIFIVVTNQRTSADSQTEMQRVNERLRNAGVDVHVVAFSQTQRPDAQVPFVTMCVDERRNTCSCTLQSSATFTSAVT